MDHLPFPRALGPWLISMKQIARLQEGQPCLPCLPLGRWHILYCLEHSRHSIKHLLNKRYLTFSAIPSAVTKRQIHPTHDWWSFWWWSYYKEAIHKTINCTPATLITIASHILMLPEITGWTQFTFCWLWMLAPSPLVTLDALFLSYGLSCLIYKTGITELTFLVPLRVFYEVNSSHSQGHSTTPINNSWMFQLVRIRNNCNAVIII